MSCFKLLNLYIYIKTGTCAVYFVALKNKKIHFVIIKNIICCVIMFIFTSNIIKQMKLKNYDVTFGCVSLHLSKFYRNAYVIMYVFAKKIYHHWLH